MPEGQGCGFRVVRGQRRVAPPDFFRLARVRDPEPVFEQLLFQDGGREAALALVLSLPPVFQEHHDARLGRLRVIIRHTWRCDQKRTLG